MQPVFKQFCADKYWGRYHQEPSSQLITLNNQIFPVKDSNLQSSSLVGLVAKSSVVKTRQFLKSSVFTFTILSIFQSSFSTKANLQTSKKPGYPPNIWDTFHQSEGPFARLKWLLAAMVICHHRHGGLGVIWRDRMRCLGLCLQIRHFSGRRDRRCMFISPSKCHVSFPIFVLIEPTAPTMQQSWWLLCIDCPTVPIFW